MNLKEKIKNSIKTYIVGDALGVPFEFRKKGTFNCKKFEGFQTHDQKPGTWSDDTSILLCLMEALTYSPNLLLNVQRYKANLIAWYNNGEFSVEGLFDIGKQTNEAIICEFQKQKKTSRMGNGALFYSLPLACIFLNQELDTKRIFEKFCSVTHNNNICFEFGLDFSLILRDLLLSLPMKRNVSQFRNCGDVKNTLFLIIDFFNRVKERETTSFEDLCEIVNLGRDTDTNAALFGALIGTVKPIDENCWRKVQRWEYLESNINSFINSIEQIIPPINVIR